MIVWADILVVPILHTKSSRNRSELDKAKPLIKMPRMYVAFDHCIELQYPESECSFHFQAVYYQLLANVLAAGIR